MVIIHSSLIVHGASEWKKKSFRVATENFTGRSEISAAWRHVYAVHLHDTCTPPGKARGWAGNTEALGTDAAFSKPLSRDFSRPQHVTSQICTVLSAEQPEHLS